MAIVSDPADTLDAHLDAQADGAFAGKPAPVSVNHRAGYGQLDMAFAVARKGGTLAAGEGLAIIEHYEARIANLLNALRVIHDCTDTFLTTERNRHVR